MFNARKNNAGWRIDYFLVSDRLKDAIYGAPIHSDILGSDHCPVELELGISCNGSIWLSDAEGTATQIKSEGLPLSSQAKKVLLSGTACLLLALGFTAGFFTNRLISRKDTDANLSNTDDLPLYLSSSSYPYTVISPAGSAIQQISAERAKRMTTDRLISYAVQIPELINYYSFSATSIYSSVVTPIKLDPQDFKTFKRIYPVLAELETREDAGSKMRRQLYAVSGTTYHTKVLSLLLSLDVFQSQYDGLDPRYVNSITTDDVVIIPVAPTGEQ